MSPIIFSAPWSTRLKRISISACVVLLLLGLLGIALAPPKSTVAYFILAGTLAAVVIVAALCMVRGYTLTDSEILIRRVAWTTRLPLKSLESVEGDAEALTRSFKLIGNYGLFSYTGRYWNRRLGLHRVYATDPSRAVVLRYPNKTIVITPHDPQRFIVRARTLLKAADFPL